MTVAAPVQVGFNFFDPVQFETMQRVCKMFASSELVPDMYKVTDKNPIEKAMANCMIAIEIAQRIGASPLMVMQNMVPIYGKPSWSSKFLVATVNTCGRFKPLKYRFTEKGMLGMVDYVEYTKVWVNGELAGSIGIIAPEIRIETDDYLITLRELVRRHAAGLSADMGYEARRIV